MILHFQYHDGDEELKNTKFVDISDMTSIKPKLVDPRWGSFKSISKDKKRVISDSEYQKSGGHCFLYTEYGQDNVNDLWIDTEIFDIWSDIEFSPSESVWGTNIVKKIKSIITPILRDKKIGRIVDPDI